MRRNDVIIGQLDLEGRIRQHLNYGAFKLNNVILWQKNLSFPKRSAFILRLCFAPVVGDDTADAAVIAHPRFNHPDTFRAGKHKGFQMSELLFLGIGTFSQPSVCSCNDTVAVIGDDKKQPPGISAGTGQRDVPNHGSGVRTLRLFRRNACRFGCCSGTKTVFVVI